MGVHGAFILFPAHNVAVFSTLYISKSSIHNPGCRLSLGLVLAGRHGPYGAQDGVVDGDLGFGMRPRASRMAGWETALKYSGRLSTTSVSWNLVLECIFRLFLC